MRSEITISKRIVDAAQPGQKIYDKTLKGFLLVVTPAGTKSYAIEYRVGSGRLAEKRRLVIGKHGSPWTPDSARKRAETLLAEVKLGRDPAGQRKAEREATTFADLIDLYFAEGVSHKKPSTLANDRGRAERHLRPLLGRLRVDKISRADIERMRDAVASGKTAVKKGERRRAGGVARGGKGAAAQSVRLASTILAFAIDRNLRVDNPATGIKIAPTRKVERFLSEVEITRLANALDAAEEKTGNPFPTAAIKLLLFTGCRKGEIIGLQWPWVDFERACLRLPDSKTGPKVIPLNPPAMALLESLPRESGNSHVITGVRAETAGPAVGKLWTQVRKAAGLTDVRLHDLRHSFASIAVSGGGSLPIIGKLLGHRNAATTERYAHLEDNPVRAVTNMVGERIAAAMAGRGKVVPLRRPS